jgi:hypothetical protein
MLTFGLALLLLLASVGIVGATLARRGSAEQAAESPTPEPTAFVAIVETPAPSLAPTTTRPAVTTRTAAASTAPRVTATTTGVPLGAGPGRAARGIAGSMAVSLGGTLPPPEVAAAPPSTQPGAAQSQTSLPTATAAIAPTPTPVRSTGGGSSSGGGSAPTPTPNRGSTGGGTSGGGSSYTPPTPTPYIAPTPTRVPPTATAQPTPTPGLPAAVLPGPGSKTYSYNLTFTQSAPLTPPTGAQAWVATWRTFTIDDVNTLKAALGMTGAVEQSGGGFKVTTPGTLLINNTLGTISYTAPGSTASSSVSALALPTITALTPVAEASPSPKASSTPAPANTPAPPAQPSNGPSGTPARPAGSPAPASPTAASKLGDPEALAAAKAWLTKTGIMPADADAGKVTRPTTDQVVVTYHPKTPGTLIPQDPMIQVKLGLDGTVREVYHRWPTNLVPREAATRDLAAAWNDVVTGGGYLEVDQTIPQDLPANTIFKGNAVVARVAIGWAPGTDGKTNYLIPLYVFEGSVTLTNPPGGQPATVPFRVYVPATVAP